MPFSQMPNFFKHWFDRKQGGLGPEKATLDSIQNQEDRDRIYDALLRVCWRGYQKGRNDGRRGYSEMVIRRKAGAAKRKSNRGREFVIREDE